MTYKGAINEVKSLANNSLMPVIFKPSLKKIAETLEMERPKELTLSEVETYANEHNYVLWTDEMSEKALALIKAVIKADRNRPKGEWDIFGYPSDEDIRQCNEDYICSNCKDFVVNRRMKVLCNFCPNCGADMRAESEDK